MADTVEVIRCKDCQYCMIFVNPKEKGIGYPYCHYRKEPMAVWGDDYCSKAKRKHTRTPKERGADE
jgi:hypothetical protein